MNEALSHPVQVLPRVMEQIVSCKDGIAQQYLMQCIIQVGVGLLWVRRLTPAAQY